MHILTAPSFDNAYSDLCNEVFRLGWRAEPRGLPCCEIRPAQFRISDASKGLYSGRSRRLNYRFFAVEALTYIAGWGDCRRHAELLCSVNKNMARFVNPETGMFDGAYGPRLKQSLPAIFDLLRQDPDSRQAYASIWSPGLPAPSADIPCTLGMHFYREQRRNDPAKVLGMCAMMRSNDLNWGTPYDVASFCAIQCLMAGCLGWETGGYTHHAGSLHLYEDSPPRVSDHEAEEWLEDAPRIPVIGKDDLGRWGWREMADGASTLLAAAARHCLDLGEHWALFDHTLARSGKQAYYWRGWVDLFRRGWLSSGQPADSAALPPRPQQNVQGMR